MAKRAPERHHLIAEIAFLDDRARPDPTEQLVLADHLAGLLDQCQKNHQGAVTERHRHAVTLQPPFCRN
ncbi:MAG: hypothetical protein WDN69_13780 [Aliidongia sp.]